MPAGKFLSCLYGSEQTRQNYLEKLKFLSCLYGSELRRRILRGDTRRQAVVNHF